MIPKVIHYCWFGGNTLPSSAQKCIESWKKYCPDYEIREWNESSFDISSAPLYVQQAYGAKKWAFVTDFVRLFAVYHNGGVYLDTDVELIQNIDPLLAYNAFFGYEDVYRVATGLGFGAIAGLPLLKTLMDDYMDCTFLTEDGVFDLLPCPQRNASVFEKNGLNADGKKQILQDNILILPPEYLCPLDYQTGRMNITDQTFSIHWFSASWVDDNAKRYKRDLDWIARFIGHYNADRLLGVMSCVKKEGLFHYVAKRIKRRLSH